MAWRSEMVRILRYLIGDLADSPTYSDDRLEETILVAATIVIQDADFSTTYSVDVDELILSPDPTLGTKDNNFIVLTCLKAGCIIDMSTYRTMAAQIGISIKDGNTSIDTRGQADAYKTIAERGLCKEYDETLKQYLFGIDVGCHAILGPFSGPNVYTGGNSPNYDPRNRFY